MQADEGRAVDPQKRRLTLLIIWGVILMNVVMLFALANMLAPAQAVLPKNGTLVFALTALGTFTAIGSFFFRQRLTKRAIEQQRPQSLSSGYIVAFAMCEVAALCGVIIRLTTNDSSYYLLFIIAVFGLVLNLPRLDDVINASAGKRM